MSAKAAHIIRKQQYDIAVTDQQQGRSMQHLLQNLNLQYVLPALSSKLDEMFATDEVVVIEKIEIDIGAIKKDTRPQEWVEKILEGLQAAVISIEIKMAGDNVKKINLSIHAIKVWLYFLRTGMLPAETFFKSLSEVKDEIFKLKTDDSVFLKEELLKLFPSTSVVQRLSGLKEEELFFVVNLFIPGVSPWQWQELLEKLFSSITEIAKQHAKKVSYSSLFLKRQVIFYTLTEVFEKAGSGKQLQMAELFDAVKERLSVLPSDNGKQQEADLEKSEKERAVRDANETQLREKKSNENQEATLLPEEGVFMNNAGLCLLAPYLPLFFKATGLTDSGAFFDEIKQQRAIFLLHYLATGETDPTEEKLVFAKLLCAWPLQMPCFLSEEITAFEMKEANDLLQSVIEHWGALKNTSPDGLREGFLRRDGKLIESDEQLLLQVEPQSIDILLEQVPWTFRMIKLPWMQKLVSVEWY